MFKVGDRVIFVPDGSKGVIIEVNETLCHVVWEDHMSSWERKDSLKQQEGYR